MTQTPERRWAVLALTVCLLALPAGLLNKPIEVRAWSNGVSGPNGYGTHVWILDKAIKTLKKRTNKTNWVKLQVALWATDDPETRGGIDYASSPWWHVYDIPGGRYGNAPEAIRIWFKKAAKQLAGKHRGKASRSLGILAHLLGDLANPMHTDQTSREEGIHSSYEATVDCRSGKRDTTYRFHYDGRHSGKPGAKAKHVAAQAHKAYTALVRAYSRNGYSTKVHRITRRQLSRAANAVADVAAAIKAAAKRLGGGGDGSNCSSAYPDVCIPPPPPNLDCDEINYENFRVVKHPLREGCSLIRSILHETIRFRP